MPFAKTRTESLDSISPVPQGTERTKASAKALPESPAKKIARFLHRISDVLLWTIVIGLVAVLWPNILAPLATKRVVLLTGPDGGFDRHLGKDLRQTYRLATPGRFWGRHFEFEDEVTQGSEENREIVDRDSAGTHIAFALDGFEPTPNIRSMLKLFEVPLHIVVRRDFYERCQPGDRTARTFADIARVLRTSSRRNVYLGLDKSGARQVAKIVLKHHHVDVEAVDCRREYDLNDVQYALVDGRIDVAFVIGRLGSASIQFLADSQECYLLGLDGDVEGLTDANRFLRTMSIAKHVYGTNEFQPAAINTVAASEVLICSASMSKTDAFWLTSSLDEFLVSHFPEEVGARNLASDGEQPSFKYPQHAGAKAFAEGSAPWFVQSTNYVLLMILLPAIVAFLQRAPTAIVQWFTGHGPDGAPPPHTSPPATVSTLPPTSPPTLPPTLPPTSPPMAAVEATSKRYDKLHAELEKLLSELEQHAPPLAEQEAADFAAKIWALRRDVALSVMHGQIDHHQGDSLRGGLRNLQVDLAQLQPTPHPSPAVVPQAPMPAVGVKAAKKKQ